MYSPPPRERNLAQILSSIVIQRLKRYNIHVKHTQIAVLFLCLLTLTQCGGKEPEKPLQVSGARSALFSTQRVTSTLPGQRPSAPLGVFSSLYLAQGMFLPVQSALQGIEAQSKLLAGQRVTATDETFALLQDFGSILQVDIIDLLNRSDDRLQALDRYLQDLRNVGVLVERKSNELEVLLETLQDQRKEQRSTVRDLEREIKNALNEQDYGTAGALQQQLTEAQGVLAETESREDQTEDILSRYEDLLAIAQDRLDAIEKNREILIAGLKVIEVPGIEDLRILEPGSKRSRRGGIFDI